MKNFQFLYQKNKLKLKIAPSSDPEFPPLNTYPKEMESVAGRDIYYHVYLSTIHNRHNLDVQCWTNVRKWSLKNIIQPKKEGNPNVCDNKMNVEVTTPSDTNQVQKDKPARHVKSESPTSRSRRWTRSWEGEITKSRWCTVGQSLRSNTQQGDCI